MLHVMSLYLRSLVLFLSVFPPVVQLVTDSLSQLAFQASVMHSGICHALCSLQSFKGVSAMVLTYLGLSATIVIISNV